MCGRVTGRAHGDRGGEYIACVHESLENGMAMRKSSGMHSGSHRWRGDYEERDKSGVARPDHILTSSSML